MNIFEVISNYRNGHTGQLSAVTVFLLAAGAVIRVFTSIQETGDKVIISTYVVSSAVNMLLLLQVRGMNDENGCILLKFCCSRLSFNPCLTKFLINSSEALLLQLQILIYVPFRHFSYHCKAVKIIVRYGPLWGLDEYRACFGGWWGII